VADPTTQSQNSPASGSNPPQTGGQTGVEETLEGISAHHATRSLRYRPWFQAWDTTIRDEVEDENGWLMTFGDLMSLLLVMFVFIVAFASFEPERYSVSQETQPAEGTGQQTAETPSLPVEPSPPVPEPLVELDPAFESLGDDVQISIQKGKINLLIQDRILFAAGTANLTNEGLPVLDRIANLIKDKPYEVSIEGHTDNTPIRSIRYPSNWELSTARAAAVLRHLIERGVPAERMRAIGYADTRPIAPNDSPASRAKNRRVELVLHLDPAQENTEPSP
jgi:chemotaxis protein MotB